MGVIEGYQRGAEVRAALICWETQKVINVVLKRKRQLMGVLEGYQRRAEVRAA